MIKVIVNGAKGRMGRLAVKAIQADKELELVAETTRQSDLETIIAQTHAFVVVDLTDPTAVFENARSIIQSNAHPVIGTTGLKPEQVKHLQALCKTKQLGGIIAPNFSLGAVLMMKFAEQAAYYFESCEIIERHHENKHDAPSGTAIRTADLISQIRINKLLPVDQHDQKSYARGERQHSIPIHSIRLPGSLAHQTVMFGEKGETLMLQHDTIERECFMPGILLSCKKVVELKELIVGLENIL